MRHEINTSEDLDYLAGIGFETVETSDADLIELKEKIGQRVSADGGGMIATAVLTTLFLSVNVFFAFYNQEVIWPTHSDKQMTINKALSSTDSLPLNYLEEISVSPEKFILKETSLGALADDSGLDTLQVMPLQPVKTADSLLPLQQSEQLRTILNSEITYIHDLKVSNYRSMYFKRRANDGLSGVPAAYASKLTTREVPRLKEHAEIFLHEQVAEALLYFKRESYADCIALLYEILPYNQNDINCSFYLGMCFYYTANYSKALRYFEECFNPLNNAFAEEALFYKASCLYQSGRAEAATPLFKEISAGNGFYSLRAKAILNQ